MSDSPQTKTNKQTSERERTEWDGMNWNRFEKKRRRLEKGPRIRRTKKRKGRKEEQDEIDETILIEQITNLVPLSSSHKATSG